MVDYTRFMVAQKEYAELAQSRPVEEGIRVYEAGPVRRGLVGLGGLLVAVGHRLQGPAGPVSARPTEAGSGD
jgi:hypothetical protein